MGLASQDAAEAVGRLRAGQGGDPGAGRRPAVEQFRAHPQAEARPGEGGRHRRARERPGARRARALPRPGGHDDLGPLSRVEVGAEGRLFAWGNDEPGDQLCWGGKAGSRKVSCPIGSFPKGDNPQGIHDLTGNVYEWTTSASDKTSTIRHGRGGSWIDTAKDLFRNDRPFIFKTTYRCGFLGIRCATTPG